MNFFEKQENARKKTKLLIFYFLIAIVLTIIAIDFIILGSMLYSGTYDMYTSMIPITEPNKIRFLFFQILYYISPMVILIILLGSLFRLHQLQSGGLAVAKLVGAIPLDPNTDDINEKKFIHIVEEMSIASGIPIPRLFVMKEENGINAFVAGIKPADTVMVVTQGALTQLSREELQGVIAHEYGHIFNSDMQISLRLIGILGGLLLIGQLGLFILRSVFRGGSSSRSKKGSGVLFFLLLGLGIFIVGYIGLFFGRLMKAAVSRQRELLADASSVQFTRYPAGLVNALRKIDTHTTRTYLNTSHAEDVSHLCFLPSSPIFFSHLLDTHPSIAQRLEAIDPRHLYRATPSPPSTPSGGRSAANVVQTIGNPSDLHIVLATALLQSIPTPLLDVSHDPAQVALLYYAIVFSRHFSLYEKDTAHFESLLPKESIETIQALSQKVTQLNPQAMLPLIDLSLPAFQYHSPEERRHIFNTVEKLSASKATDLLLFALLGILGKNVENRSPEDLKIQYYDFDPVLQEVTLLLSFMVAASRKEDPVQDQRFDNTAKKLLSQPPVRIPITAIDPQKLLPALKKLNLLSPICKKKLVQACLYAIEDDQSISLSEAELMRGIATCLDCPIPPIISTD